MLALASRSAYRESFLAIYRHASGFPDDAAAVKALKTLCPARVKT